MATLTTANSSIILTILSVFPAPQALEGYATDDMFATDPVVATETMMGVDGRLSAGWVPTPKTMTIALQADSPSNVIFENWYGAMQVQKDAIVAAAVISIPSIGRAYTCVRGFLSNYPPTPNGQRVLQPRRYGITWQDIIPAPL